MSEAIDREEEAARPRRRKRRIALVAGALLLVTFVVLWTQRKPIADDFIAGELEKRGVAASYEVARIGFRTQRIEKLRIGDPANPDLTADWAEVLIRIGVTGPQVTGVRAGGVRLRGRLVKGVFSFGAVDRLLPAPSGKPFALPDLHLDIADGRARLDLPNGPIGLKLDGRGNLTGGFRGKLAAVAPALDVEGCVLTGATAWLDLSVTDRAPRVAGPVRAAAFACPAGDLSLSAPQVRVAAVLNEALNRWRGSATATIARAALGGNAMETVQGDIGFDGGRRGTTGSVKLGAARFAAAGATGEGFSLDGAYKLGGTRKGFLAALDGKLAVTRAALGPSMLRSVSGFGETGQGTPVGPLARALADAVRRAGADAALNADLTVAQLGSVGSLQLSALDLRAKSGARVTLADGAVRFAWPGRSALTVNGQFAMGGGGLPEGLVALSQAQPGGPVRGSARFQPYAAGGARLALAPVSFVEDGRSTRIETRVTLDGPVADGRVSGLSLPLSGRIGADGAITVNPNCAPLSFTSLSISSLALGQTRLALCPYQSSALFALSPAGRMSGGAAIRAPRLAGRLGGSPATLAADRAVLSLARMGFALSNAAVRLGPAERQTRLDVAALDGAMGKSGLSGNFTGLGGQIGNVPLIVSESAGRWSFAKGALQVDGGLRVADAAPEPRFNPLVSRDFTLRLASNRIVAGGMLVTPAGIGVTRVELTHDLGAGTGRATLDVPGIRFGEALQPDALTPLALGVVANVKGVVTGRGNIRWSPQAVTSDGVFRTTDANLAAAFGPVTGLSGEIRFTDLLGLETAPGQTLTIAEVNPGLAVTNGVVRYQLLPGQRVSIEGGEWPFAGGRLSLEPTILDLGAQKPRNLTFKVSGVDAAAFLQSFDFENINATGIFDGELPMVFDEQGGRIVGGRLVARPGGGGIAYIGELTKEDLGSWGNLAFQALKAIDYRELEITLNGDLAGEMITQVRFAGLSQGEGAKQNFLTKKIASLPIRFNITIRAPFRQLLFSARSFYDPSLLIEQNLPALIEAQQGRPAAVQPPESENKP